MKKEGGRKANSRFYFENIFKIPKSKLSQSGIITTVLIILLVIVAVVIVWNVVNTTVKKTSSQVSVNQFSLKGDIKYYLSTKTITNDGINVSVHRGTGSGDIIGVKLIFEFADGTSRSYENRTVYPNELETRVYSINGSNLNPVLYPSNFSNLKKISVYYIFNENNKEMITIPLDSADGPSSGSASGGGSGCTSACSPPGSKRCNLNTVENCTDINLDFCLEWSGILTCSGGTPYCNPLTGQCSATCSDSCSNYQCGTQLICGVSTSCGNCAGLSNVQSATCLDSYCKITACNSNYGNCDGNNMTGCEANLLTNNNNCGSCGNNCTAQGKTCSNGVCTSFQPLYLNFTTCGNTGRLGPTQSQCNTNYSGTSLQGNVTVTNGYQYWTVPNGVTSIIIEAIGAGGGTQVNAGKGARMIGVFSVTPGQQLKILVGQKGVIGSAGSAGGGGGTFVAYANNTPLIVAGGGGGQYLINSALYNSNGIISTSGNSSGCTTGGLNGLGGNGCMTNGASGGGGLLGNGINGVWGTGGQAFINGGTGGSASQDIAEGGFGGGGGSHGNSGGGGGGGGYSGGAGGFHDDTSGNGGGGGSYNAGTNQNNVAGYNPGQGKVNINRLS